MGDTLGRFRIDGQVAIVTGGAGLLGVRHAEAIAEAGGNPVLWDVDAARIETVCRDLAELYPDISCRGQVVDITDENAVNVAVEQVLDTSKRIDILINNAANDPKVKPGQSSCWSRLEHYGVKNWEDDLAVGLTGAFLCGREIGGYMAKHGGGVILNIASDLGVIAPDQRIYRKENCADEDQPVKPVTYSVVKHGLIGLTKYLATYWIDQGVRVNALSPGGVYTDQPDAFVEKLTQLIPMGRMAHQDEYKAAVLFLVSEASSYMTGANLSIDGGRTCW